MSKQCIVAENRVCQSSTFNAVVKYIDLLRSRRRSASVSKTNQSTSSSILKGGREQLSAALLENIKKQAILKTPHFGNARNF